MVNSGEKQQLTFLIYLAEMFLRRLSLYSSFFPPVFWILAERIWSLKHAEHWWYFQPCNVEDRKLSSNMGTHVHHRLFQVFSEEEKHPNEYFSEIASSFSHLCLTFSNITSPFPPLIPSCYIFLPMLKWKPSAWALISLISAPTPLHSHITTQISREQRRFSAALLLFKPSEWFLSICSEKTSILFRWMIRASVKWLTFKCRRK